MRVRLCLRPPLQVCLWQQLLRLFLPFAERLKRLKHLQRPVHPKCPVHPKRPARRRHLTRPHPPRRLLLRRPQ